ncbi:MAG: DUF4093 domain-containing protein [Oscillospiraceae bacterium]|jgi:ribonuclease M5|nr:DUF4093 domain-containing protein [Oscillospiraceae bacterium]
MLPDYSEKPRIKEAILVEGRYDKSTLSNAVDANIVELGGFRLYKDKELLSLIRRLAAACGVIILTDSDRAGFQLRNYLKGAVNGIVKHAYIPDVAGKEKRKAKPSAEGKLGVEGMQVSALRNALIIAGATIAGENSDSIVSALTKSDFYELGLSGGANSAIKRRELTRRFNLPERLSADALLSVLNALGVAKSDL